MPRLRTKLSAILNEKHEVLVKRRCEERWNNNHSISVSIKFYTGYIIAFVSPSFIK